MNIDLASLKNMLPQNLSPWAIAGLVAAAIITLLLAFIIPRFQAVFDGLLNGRPMPACKRD